jgi:putative transposase
MDLTTNSTFRLLEGSEVSTNFEPGIYRVILDEPKVDQTVTVLIQANRETERHRGGRKRKADANLRRPRKKPPTPLIGTLIWMRRSDLQALFDSKLLKPIEIQRRVIPEPSASGQALYERRVVAMQGFLDLKNLRESIVVHEGLGGLVAEALARARVTRPYVYKQWSNLCRWGLDEKSLAVQFDRCGAPGVSRPCDPYSVDRPARKKAGRKTLKQRIAFAFGGPLNPEAPGMSSEWAAAIRAADKKIAIPKPAWSRRFDLIITSAFCAKAVEVDGRIELVKPESGTYPNLQQVKRVLTVNKTSLERLIERTTLRHYKTAMRGLTGRNWRDVSGPGHTWAIDSTVGDIYLRSALNRAWIVGRPIVYIVVDVWSTAVVGFYVCLTGPNWSTAKVALFNSAADPSLVADLWGYQPILSLQPAPTLCYAILCDRAEYLSQGHRSTAIRLIPLTQYAPPYRGDLKGLVEVIHRIEKDAQFLFIPGAMDFRRAEMELRKVDPSKCCMTVREYVQYLYELFTSYNLTADRSNRLDAHMIAAGVFPSPAGLWRFGHEVGIAFRRHIGQEDLITEFLPGAQARVRRDAVRYAGCDYSSKEVEKQDWTSYARAFGGWDVPVHYYPGSMSSIWTPNVGGSGLFRLQISDQTRASAELTVDEWSDALAVATMQRAGTQHERTMSALDSLARIEALRASAVKLTAEAVAKSTGPVPSMTEARLMEVAANAHPSGSEAKATAQVQQDAIEQHNAMMAALLASANG